MRIPPIAAFPGRFPPWPSVGRRCLSVACTGGLIDKIRLAMDTSSGAAWARKELSPASASKKRTGGGGSKVAALPRPTFQAAARDAALAHLQASTSGEALLLLRGLTRGKLKVRVLQHSACTCVLGCPTYRCLARGAQDGRQHPVGGSQAGSRALPPRVLLVLATSGSGWRRGWRQSSPPPPLFLPAARPPARRLSTPPCSTPPPSLITSSDCGAGSPRVRERACLLPPPHSVVCCAQPWHARAAPPPAHTGPLPAFLLQRWARRLLTTSPSQPVCGPVQRLPARRRQQRWGSRRGQQGRRRRGQALYRRRPGQSPPKRTAPAWRRRLPWSWTSPRCVGWGGGG